MTSEIAGTPCIRCLQPGQPGVACRICGWPESPPSFTLVYEARHSGAAMSAFKKDAARLAQLGYVPMGRPVWVTGDEDGGGRTVVKVILGRGVAGLVPPPGYLRVEYRRSDLTPEEATARPDDAIKWSS